MDIEQENSIRNGEESPTGLPADTPNPANGRAGMSRNFSARATPDDALTAADSTPGIHEGGPFASERSAEYSPALTRDERRQTFKEMRRQLTFARALTDSLGEGVYALDPAGRVTFMNPAAERMLGWSERELLGKDMHETIHYQHVDGSAFPKAECPLLAVAHSGQVVRCEDDVFVRKDGSLVPIAYTSAPVVTDGQLTGTVLAFYDISARKRAEQRLRLQYSVSRILSDVSDIERGATATLREIGTSLGWDVGTFWLVSAGGQFLRAIATWQAREDLYDAFAIASRRSRHAPGAGLPGRVWLTSEPISIDDLTVEQDDPYLARARAAGLRSAFAFPVRGDQKTLGVIEFFSTQPRTQDEDLLLPAAAIGHQIGQYIEKRQAEAAQRAGESRIQAILTTAPDGIITIDASGRVTEFNAAAERLFGYTHEQALGQQIADLIIPPDLRERHLAGMARYLVTGQAVVLDQRLRLQARRADGSFFPVELTITRIPVDGPPVFTAHLRDITEQVHAELEKNRLLHREQRARAQAEEASKRLRALQSITDTALAHLPLGDLTQRLIERIGEIMTVDQVSIVLLTPDHQQVALYSARARAADATEQSPLPLGQGIIAGIIQNRQPVLIDDLTTADPPDPLLPAQLCSFAGAPLLSGDRVLGVLYIGTIEGRHFTREDLYLLELISDRVALAIDDAYLYDAERKARTAAERAQRRFEFLAKAGTVLASSLKYEHTLSQLAWLIVPELADGCTIDLFEEDGSIQRLATAQRDPEKLRQMHSLRERAPLESALGYPVLHVLRTGEALLLGEITDDLIARSADDNHEVLEILRALDYRSGVCVPLRARGWIVGALTMLAGESGRAYGVDDLAMAEDLGRRAGLAVDNARLFKQTQRALHQVEEIADQVLMQATQLDAVIQAIPGVVFVADAEGHIARVNPSGAAMLGIDLEQASSLEASVNGADSFFSPDGKPLPHGDYPLAQALQGRTSIDFRCMMRRFDTGEDVQLLVSFAPIRDNTGGITGAVAVGNDVSAIYRLEQQKDEFLSIASHEMKTPLTSLKILAQLTRRRLTKAGAKEAEQLAGMERSIERMERLVNDLLDVSRIQGGKLAMRPENCDLTAICAQTTEEQSAATERAITLDLPSEPLNTVADPERIGQVITNLVSNALKYSPPSCQVMVSLRRESENQAHIVVRDEGAGIPPELQQHLFERFYRVPGVQVQSGSGVGLGLGLYISREIIERHHGRIWVESDVGQGAEFHILLPLVAPTDGQRALDG